MPLYEYECFLCRFRFERIQRADAEPIRDCPACGGKVRRLLGTPALQFKGSGWYVTDYAGGDSSKTASDEAGAQSPDSSPGADSDSTVKDGAKTASTDHS